MIINEENEFELPNLKTYDVKPTAVKAPFSAFINNDEKIKVLNTGKSALLYHKKSPLSSPREKP